MASTHGEGIDNRTPEQRRRLLRLAIAACMLARAVGVDPKKVNYVAFRGGGPIAQGLASGDIQVGKMGVGNFLSLADGGKLKLVAVDSPQRIKLLPNVPTLSEAGLGDFKFVGWWGLAAPHGTPAPAIARLNAEFVKLFNEPKFVEFLDKQVVRTSTTTPAEFAAFVKSDRETAASLIKAANTPREDFTPPDPAKK